MIKFLLGLTLLHQASCILEEESGIDDWYQMNIGRVTHFGQHKRNLILGSSSSVLASVKADSGAISWRQALPEGESFDYMTTVSKKVLTMSNGGETVRLWGAHDGSLLWDSDTFVKDMKSHHLSHKLRPKPNKASEKRMDAIFLENKVIATLVDDTVTARQLEDGLVLWSFTAPPWHRVLAMSVDGDTTGDLHVVCAKSNGGESVVVFSLGSMSGEQEDTRTLSQRTVVATSDDLIIISNVAVLLDRSKSTISVHVLANEEPDAETSVVVVKLDDPSFLSQEYLSDLQGEVRVEDVGMPLAFVLHTASASHLVQLSMDDSDSGKCTAEQCGIALSSLYTIPRTTTSEEQHLYIGSVTGVSAYARSTKGVLTVDVHDGDIISSVASDIELSGRGRITHGMLFTKASSSGGVPSYRVALSFEDHSLALIQNNNVLWIREEALASITEVQFVDPISSFASSENGYPPFHARINGKFNTLKTKVEEVVTSINDLIQGTDKRRGERSGAVAGAAVGLKHTVEKDVFGLHKIVVALTDANKIIALDSHTGDTVWSLFFGTTDIARHLLHISQRSVVVVLETSDSATVMVELNPFTGVVVKREAMPFPVVDIVEVCVGEGGHKQFALISDDFRVQVFPLGSTDAKLTEVFAEGLFFHRTKISEGTVTGYLMRGPLANIKTTEQWKHSFPEVEQISAIASGTNQPISSPVRIVGDREAYLHKYLNPHLLAVATQRTPLGGGGAATRATDTSVNLYLIDGVSGSMVERIIHGGGQGPVSMAMTENVVVYHYFNSESHNYEVSVVELYEDRSSLATTKEADLPTFSSFATVPPTTLQQTYVIRKAVKGITVTNTAGGITNKHFLFSLVSGQVLGVHKHVLDPRRPTGEPSVTDKKEGLMPYAMELPSHPVLMATYNRTIANLRGVVTAPATLESTSLVFAFGVDLFSTRVMPSKTFDQLSQEFNYPVLVASVVIVLLLLPVLTHMNRKKELATAWK